MKADAVLVLSHEINEDGLLSEDTIERIDMGIELLKKDITSLIILSGCGRNVNKDNPLSKRMKEYALSKNCEERNFIEEKISLDTVGQLIFTRFGIVEPRNIKSLIIITHVYHAKRVLEESKKIFQKKKYKINYYFIHSKIDLEKHEKGSLELFEKTFKNIDMSKEREVLNRLESSHKLYNNMAYFKKKLEEMKDENTLWKTNN